MSIPPGHNGNKELERDEFAATAAQQLQTLPDVEILDESDLTLTLRIGSTDMRLNLANFYSAYQQQPDQLDAIMAALLNAIRNLHYTRAVRSFSDLSDRVFPMLKPLTLLANLRERNLPLIVYRPFLADLIIAYVIDEPNSVAFINEEHLASWNIDEQTLHDQALANLRQRTLGATNYTASGEGAQHIIIFSSQDGYDATRLLLPELLEQWRDQFPGQMLIGIPNRDFLIIFSDADRTILANVAQQIRIDAGQQAYGLTEQLFTLQNGEVRAYEWE